MRGAEKPDGTSWHLVSQQALQKTGTQAVAASALQICQTVGFTIATVPARSALYVRWDFVSFFEATANGNIFIVSPVLIDVQMPGPICVAEYTTPPIPSRTVGLAGDIPGQVLLASPVGNDLEDDWYDSDVYRIVNGNVMPASFNVNGAVSALNADAGGPHTVSWREMLVWEVWLPASLERSSI